MTTERTVVSSRMTDEEALLTRLAESIGRPGLDATSTLELAAAWVTTEFGGEDFSDAARNRFRKKLIDHKVDLEKFQLVLNDPERFPHRNEREPRLDPEIAERMRQVRATVIRLLAGKARKHGTNQRSVEEGGGSSTTSSVVRDSAEGIVRRLNRDRPDLAAKVAAKGISPDAAAVEAGIRQERATVRIHDPRRVADQLRKHMTPDELAELITILTTP